MPLLVGYAPGGLTQALPLLEAAFPDNSSARSEASAGTAPGASVDPAVLKQRRSAMFALRHGTAIASLFGLYGLPLAEVEDALAGKRVSLQCDLGLYARSLSADCSPQDLATQLRMVNLAFTAQVGVCSCARVWLRDASCENDHYRGGGGAHSCLFLMVVLVVVVLDVVILDLFL